MTGPTPIFATHKMVFKYTVAGMQHKAQMYCDAVASADPMGYDLVGRPAVGNVGVSTVIDPFFTAVANLFTLADTTFDVAELWKRVGTTYVFLASAVPTVSPALGGFYQPATGFDVVGKASSNSTFHFYVYEGPFGIATKITSYAGASANVKLLINYLFNAAGTATAVMAWNWRVSRGGFFAGRWLAGVIDTNEKLRRMRGIK